MSNLEKAKEIVKEYYSVANCGIFNNRNFVGDVMNTIYKGEGLMIDICYSHAYFEVFGLSDADFKELKTYYQSLGKKIKDTEKIKVIINMDEDCKNAYQQGYSDAMRDFEKKQKSDVLDKIRLEIEQTITPCAINGHIIDDERFRAGINVALNVIDKLK